MLGYQHIGRLLLVLGKRLLAVATPEKHRKDYFWIGNRTIFSVMKKEYAIVAIENPERHVRRALHRGSKQQ